MNPMETLANEHGLIRRNLDNLQIALERIQDDKKVPREFFEKGVEFSRLFTDKYHHFKEEGVMFALLAQKKSGEIDGQVEALRQQHETGRNAVARISEALDGYEKGDTHSKLQLLENLSIYISQLRYHIHIEDHAFYPLAEEALTEDEMSAVGQEFLRAKEKAGEDVFEQCHKMVTDMGSILTHS